MIVCIFKILVYKDQQKLIPQAKKIRFTFLVSKLMGGFNIYYPEGHLQVPVSLYPFLSIYQCLFIYQSLSTSSYLGIYNFHSISILSCLKWLGFRKQTCLTQKKSCHTHLDMQFDHQHHTTLRHLLLDQINSINFVLNFSSVLSQRNT